MLSLLLPLIGCACASSERMTVVLNDGSKFTGRVAALSDSTLTLRHGDKTLQTIGLEYIHRISYFGSRTAAACLSGVCGAVVGVVVALQTKEPKGQLLGDLRVPAGAVVGFPIGAMLGACIIPMGPGYDLTNPEERAEAIASMRKILGETSAKR